MKTQYLASLSIYSVFQFVILAVYRDIFSLDMFLLLGFLSIELYRYCSSVTIYVDRIKFASHVLFLSTLLYNVTHFLFYSGILTYALVCVFVVLAKQLGLDYYKNNYPENKYVKFVDRTSALTWRYSKRFLTSSLLYPYKTVNTISLELSDNVYYSKVKTNLINNATRYILNNTLSNSMSLFESVSQTRQNNVATGTKTLDTMIMPDIDCSDEFDSDSE